MVTKKFAVCLVIVSSLILAACGGGGGGGGGGGLNDNAADPNDVADQTQDFTASTTDVTEEVLQGMLGSFGTAASTTKQSSDLGVGVAKLVGNDTNKHWTGIPTLKGVLGDKQVFIHPEINKAINTVLFDMGLVRYNNINGLKYGPVASLKKNFVSLATIDQTDSFCGVSGEATLTVDDGLLEGETSGTIAGDYNDCVGANQIDGSFTIDITSEGISIDQETGEVTTEETVSYNIDITYEDYTFTSTASDETCTVNGTMTISGENTFDTTDDEFSVSNGASFTDFTADCVDSDDNAENTDLASADFNLIVTGDTTTGQLLGDDSVDSPTCNTNLVALFTSAIAEGAVFAGTPELDSDLEIYIKAVPTDDACTSIAITYAFPTADGEIVVVVTDLDDDDNEAFTLCGPDPDTDDDDVWLGFTDAGSGNCTIDATESGTGDDFELDDETFACGDYPDVDWEDDAA